MNTHFAGRATRALVGTAAVALVGLSAWHARAGATEKIGGKIANKPGKAAGAPARLGALNAVSFADLSGKSYSKTTLRLNRATVFLFISSQCPVSNVYAPRFNALAAEYGKQGAQVFAVFPDDHENAADILKYAKDRKLALPIVRDARGALAASLGAQTTPEAVVVDSQGAICYRGRIDDNAVATRVTSHDLNDALNSVLKGEPVAHPTRPAFGCSIRRTGTGPATVAAGVPTYAHDVAHILRAKCESCHRPGEVAPFTLQDYKQASAWAGDIKRYTQNGQMPPWKPTAGYGAFQAVAAHTLTNSEKTILARWADAGAPQGNAKDTPAPGKYADGWQMGTPDVVLQPEKGYHLGGDGEDAYRNFIVKTNFPEDRWLRAVECRPGNRAVVHHIINYIDANHVTEKMEGQDKDGEPGFTATGGGPGFMATGFLGGWAPGNDPNALPQGVGSLLPKGANLIIQVHYHRNGKPETDLTKIGLYFQHGTIEKMSRANFVINFGFKIPSGNDNYETRATTTIREDCHIYSVMPHMHLLGRQMKLWATLPDGSEKPLVWIKDWDFNWQMTYMLEEPMALPKGSKVHLLAYYDNSDKNPRNPNKAHPRDVTWGEQTTDEMCIAFLTYTKDAEHLTINADKPAAQSASAK